MGAKQSNPLYPSRALRADPSADDSSVGEDNLSGVVFSNERPEAHESKGGFFNLEHYLRDHERRMSEPVNFVGDGSWSSKTSSWPPSGVRSPRRSRCEIGQGASVRHQPSSYPLPAVARIRLILA